MADLAYTSPADFEKELLESEVPVLIDFYADWCGPCQMMKPVVAKLEKEYAGRLKVLTVDTDVHGGLAAYFGVRGIPTFIFFAEAKKQWQKVGADPAIARMVADYFKKRA